MHVAKTLVGVLDWGLSAKDAIALPNLFFDDAGAIIENDAMGRKLAQESAVFGNPFRAEDFGSKVNAVERTATGWRGAADPRSPGPGSSDEGSCGTECDSTGGSRWWWAA